MTVLLKVESTQLGLAVDASRDNGITWRCIQLTPYRDRGGAISPFQDHVDYLAMLRGKGLNPTLKPGWQGHGTAYTVEMPDAMGVKANA